MVDDYEEDGFDINNIHWELFKYNYSDLRGSFREAIRADILSISWLLSQVNTDYSGSRFIPETDISELERFLHPELKNSVSGPVYYGFLPFFISDIRGYNDSYFNRDYDYTVSLNTPSYAGKYFQTPATYNMSNIIDFHNDLMAILIFIAAFLFVLFLVCLIEYSTFDIKKFYSAGVTKDSHVSRITHNSIIEVIFTVVPAVIVFTIALPSFSLLYSNND